MATPVSDGERDARVAAAQEKRRRKNAQDLPLSDDAPRSGMRFLLDEATADGAAEVWSEIGMVLRETDQQGVWTINEPNRVMRWVRYDPVRRAWVRSCIPLLPAPDTPDPFPSFLDDGDGDDDWSEETETKQRDEIAASTARATETAGGE